MFGRRLLLQNKNCFSSSSTFILRQKSFYSKMASATQIKPAERVSHFSRDGKHLHTIALFKVTTHFIFL